MPLTLILGPANSAKAGEVLGAFADAAQRDAVLVVPTLSDAEHYAAELAADGAVVGSVLTFAGLAREIAERVGLSERPLSPVACRHVLRRALERTRLSVLAQSASAPGFVQAASGLVSELERSLITPQRFASALRAWAAENHALAGYARELGLIYGAYARELQQWGRVDGDIFAWRALDALRAAPRSWGSTPVFFYGFDDLLGVERDAVETLSRILEVEVTVSLTYEPDRAALGARAEVVEELRSFASRVRELPPLDEHYATDSREVLHHLERSLFEPRPERVEAGGVVRLLEAGGELAQAELVAAEVLAQRQAGVPAEEIVVVCRSLRATSPALLSVFARYGLPVAGYRRLPLIRTALGRVLRALVRCAFLETSGAEAGEVGELLRWPGSPERLEQADELDAAIAREGLRTAAQSLGRLPVELEQLERLRAAEDPGAELVRQARELFAAPRLGSAALLSEEEALDAHALRAVAEATDELREAGERLRGVELLDLLDELEVSAGGPTEGEAVWLAEPLAIRARRFRVVILCGLNEGEFPASGEPDPFLSDEYRWELALASGLRLAPREDVLARERYLFYASVSRATEQVVLVYRSSDEEGNLALPSPFLADVAALLDESWPLRAQRRLLADVVWDPGDAPTAREVARARAAARAAAAGPAAVMSRQLSEVTRELVRHREVVSAGALESYADCPVKWLVERQLAPRPLAPEPGPMARGSVMHEVLE